MDQTKRRPKTIFDFFTGSSAKKTKVNEEVGSPEPGPSFHGPSTSSLSLEVAESQEIGSGEISSEECPEIHDSAGQKSKTKRSFNTKWLNQYNWLQYDENSKVMTCSLCIKNKKSNALTSGDCMNFKTSTLMRHASSKDHKDSIIADSQSGALVKNIQNIFNEKEAAVICAFKAAFWLAKENLPIMKFGSLVEFLTEMNCPDILHLNCRENVSYTSDKAAEEFIQSISHVIRQKVEDKIRLSPYVSLLCDETTDISVTKKLSVYCRVINPETMEPSTHFVCNVSVDSGTGKTIYTELKKLMTEKNIPVEKVMGLGTDGAASMTGKGEGLTGYMLRDNPMLVNYHCIAHRLALVTSQAADAIPYLVDYQSVLTGIFYYFKASAVRSHKLSDIQKVLDEPNLKIKEVHQVRWMSVYIAVETIYNILDSLITYFTQDKDAKGKGYQKKMIQYDFIATTYLLMDVLPVVSELCLTFQKADVDVSLIKVHVDHCKKSLNEIKSGRSQYHLDKLQNDHFSLERGKVVFKSNHVVQGKNNIDSIKQKFIDGILKKLDQRFPDDESNIIYAFASLAMRPISFCSQKELETWGNDKLEILIQMYGNSKQSNPTQDQPLVTMDPIIDPIKTRKEWSDVKSLVIQEGYPRDKMCQLWFLIMKYYSGEFPNLLKLSKIALSAPVHTADCERGFSAQNLIKTAQRNRLSPEIVNDLLTIKLEGGDSKDFDFKMALLHWREQKTRRIFESKSKN